MVSPSRYSDGLRAGELGFDCQQGKLFITIPSIPTRSGANPAFYPISVGESFPGVKRPGRETDRQPQSRAEVKNGGVIYPLSHIGTTLPFHCLRRNGPRHAGWKTVV
jgi:hypothetical protein